MQAIGRRQRHLIDSNTIEQSSSSSSISNLATHSNGQIDDSIASNESKIDQEQFKFKFKLKLNCVKQN